MFAKEVTGLISHKNCGAVDIAVAESREFQRNQSFQATTATGGNWDLNRLRRASYHGCAHRC